LLNDLSELLNQASQALATSLPLCCQPTWPSPHIYGMIICRKALTDIRGLNGAAPVSQTPLDIATTYTPPQEISFMVCRIQRPSLPSAVSATSAPRMAYAFSDLESG